MAWPTGTQGPAEIRHRYIKAQHKSKTETGRVLSRAKDTSGKWVFELRWPAMMQADLDAHIAAFEADQGSTFAWTHPRTLVEYTVGYFEDEIRAELSAERINHYDVTILLEQR